MFKVFVGTDFAFGHPSIVIASDDGQGNIRVVSDVTMQDAQDFSDHALRLPISQDEAVRIMDQLWNAGFRPTETKMGSETMNAMRDHINNLMWVVKKAMEK